MVGEKLTLHELRGLFTELGSGVSLARIAFLQEPSPTRLHELRIAVRSARSLIVLTRDSFESVELNEARHAGARISLLTGRARNLDVFAEHWHDLTLELDPDIVMNLAPVLRQINSIRESEYRTIHASLADLEFAPFETELERLAALPLSSLTADVVVRRAIRRINKRIVHISGSLSELAADEVLHQARKDLKKLRYSLEMTRSHFPARSLDKFAETLSDLQTTIGRHQDAVTFSNELWLAARKLGTRVGSDTVVSIGILLNPIEEVRRNARRKSLAKLRAYSSDEVQQSLKKLVGSLD
jgi:CHAD domain-containing protein